MKRPDGGWGAKEAIITFLVVTGFLFLWAIFLEVTA